MRLGVLADVHGNLPALRAAVERMRKLGVEGWLCPGDLVGYGPQPNECVDELRALDCVCVAGNHDLIATGRLDASDAGEWARRTLDWTREAMTRDVREFLARLPPRAEAGSALLAHGSLDDPNEYLDNGPRVEQELQRVTSEWPRARALVVGHTHRSVAFSASAGRRLGGRAGRVELREGPWLLNPGSVGQPRAWRTGARAMVLDLDEGIAEFLVVPYDVEACRRRLRGLGLPEPGCHLRPTARETLGRIRSRRF